MPEGDSVARAADKIRPTLVGQSLALVGGSAPTVRRHAARLRRRRVHEIRTVGKHLVIDVQGGWSIHVHLGMTGRWQVRKGGPPPGRAKLVLGTARGTVVCLDAPTVEADRTAAIDRELDVFGPDVLADDFDPTEVARRAGELDRPVTDVLLNQRVMAGVGNEYKAELLFRLGWHPLRRSTDVSETEWLRAAEQARLLVAANVDRPVRSTTGMVTPDTRTWVYGRAGRPCRRCGTRIEQDRLGSPVRVTYWCPTCQPTQTGRD